MLKRLKIERFKSIYDQNITFGAANLFIGPNGSGKSNVLEALGFLGAALSSGIEPLALDLKGVRLSLPHIFKSAFKNHDLPKTFRLEAEFESGRYECSIRAGVNTPLEFFSEALYDGDAQVYGRSAHGTKLHSAAQYFPRFSKELVPNSRSVWSIIEPFVEVSASLSRDLAQLSSYAIYAPQTAIMRGMAIDQRVVEPLGLTGSGLAGALESLKLKSADELRKVFGVVWEPGWANMIRAGSFDPTIVPAQVKSEGLLLYIRDKFMHADRNMLSAFDASEGTLYLIFVAVLLAHSDTPKTFALDNVDGTLNPKLVRKLAKHVVDTMMSADDCSRQAFMTSHHPSSLDSFDIFDSKQRIFVCYRNGDEGTVQGGTIVKNLTPPTGTSREEWTITHRGKNLSELLLDNRILGAL